MERISLNSKVHNKNYFKHQYPDLRKRDDFWHMLVALMFKRKKVVILVLLEPRRRSLMARVFKTVLQSN